MRNKRWLRLALLAPAFSTAVVNFSSATPFHVRTQATWLDAVQTDNETLGRELLGYGTFENVSTGGTPTGWGALPAGYIGSGYYSRVSNDGWACNGEKFMFLRMRGSSDGNSANMLYFKMKNLTGGSTYKLTFNYKGHKDFPGTIAVKAMLDYKNYVTDSYALGDIQTMQAETTGNSGTSSTTRTLIGHFTIPTGQTSAYIVFVPNGSANMYIDDLTLNKVLGEGIEDDPIVTDDDDAPVESPTEGVITTDFISEQQMMNDILQMIANNMVYAKSIYTNAGNNSEGTGLGYFKGWSAGQNNEDGVRTNADFAFICAFLYKYGQAKAQLPAGITWNEVKDMAVKSLCYGYSTHRSLMLSKCTNNDYWGSTDVLANGSGDYYVWESSMWTESLAFAAWMLGDELTNVQKARVKTMICAEATLELRRDIPWGYSDDTKAEENGWDTNILACAAALYPDHPNADSWYYKCQQFAMNTYSVSQDKYNYKIVDGKRVRDWHIGQNLFDDYTLQNHNFFHTSYQNIAIQELSESYMALHAMQSNTEKCRFALPDALKHNVQPMFDHVLKQLAMADGELAMPNGNDWSMFLYDQLASYSAMACIHRDADALLLENMAFKYTQARQTTTTDGSWMLNSDIGPRRMGVTGRRVAMTYLYHLYFSTAYMQPSTWDDFSARVETTKYFPWVNVIRSNTADRFTSFSWATSKKSYTGMIGTSSPDKNKILVPYRYNNTGNFLGYYKMSGKSDDATPTISGYYGMFPKAYTMNGALKTNGGSLDHRFVLYSTSGNAVIYMDYVKGISSGTLSGERGGLMGISIDPFTRTSRKLYHKEGSFTSDGSTLQTFKSNWVNIDNEIGIIAKNEGKSMAFGDKELVNSIQTAKIYPIYSNEQRSFGTINAFDRRYVVYYSNIDKTTTEIMAARTQDLTTADTWNKKWNGVIVPDPDGTNYLLLSNFEALLSSGASIKVQCEEGAPVFEITTTIEKDSASATFYCSKDYNISNELKVFIQGANYLQAVQADSDATAAYLFNPSDTTSPLGVDTVKVTIIKNHRKVTGTVIIRPKETILVEAKNEMIVTTAVKNFPASYRDVARGKHVIAASQLPENLPFNVLDNNDDTYWQSLNAPANGNEYLLIRLRNCYTVDKVVITPVAGYSPATVEIEGTASSTATNFKTLTTASLANDDSPQEVSFEATDIRYIRIKITSGYGKQVAVRNLKVMGTPVERN